MQDLWIPIVFLVAIVVGLILESYVKRKNKKLINNKNPHIPYQDEDEEPEE